MWVAQDQIGRLNKTKNGTCLLTHIFVLCTQNPSHFFFSPFSLFSFYLSLQTIGSKSCQSQLFCFLLVPGLPAQVLRYWKNKS